jgi:membrane protease YdiL (CAAX protease family)
MAQAVPVLQSDNPLPPMRLRLRDLLIVVAGALAGFVAAVILLVAVTLADRTYFDRNPALLILLGTLLIYLLIGAGIALALRRLTFPGKFLGLRTPSLGTIPLLAGLLLVWIVGEAILVTAATFVLNHGEQIKGNTSDLFTGQPAGPGLLLLALLVTSVAAPITEEVFFRGMLYRYLRQAWPVWAAASVSAVIFGLLHFFPVLLPVFIFWGILLALVYERTGSLTNAILLHAAGNALATVLVYWSFTRAG